MEKTDSLFLKAVSYGLKAQVMEEPFLSGEEWEMLLNRSIEQSLLPLVFEAVHPYLPKELESRYRAITLSWIMRQVRSTDEFLKTYRALQQQGIEPLVFKGIVCRNAYRLSDWRVSADEDIYVKQDDYMELHRCLTDLGFKCREPNFRSEHESIYYGKDLKLEGHWQIFPQENTMWEEMNTIAGGFTERAVRMEIDGVRILTPDPTDHMIYLLLHAMKHFSLAGVGIRQICDVTVWNSKYSIDWDRVRDTMTRVGGLTFAQAVLDAGNRYFEMPMPEGWSRTDSTDLILDSLSGGVFGHSSQDRLHSAAITSSSSAYGSSTAFSILKAAFPSRAVMEINYPWVSKSPLLLPVGWGVRFLRYAKNMGRSISPMGSIRIGTRRMKLLKEYGIFQSQTQREKR